MKRDEILLAVLFRAGAAMARRHPPEGKLPVGLAARVAARWVAAGDTDSGVAIWETVCSRVAIGMAAVACLAQVWMSFPGSAREPALVPLETMVWKMVFEP